jgi:tetratricopeptide (TPR) repeat protein
VTEIFFRSSLFGNMIPDDLDSRDTSAKNVNALLVLAESNHKRGKIDHAKMIYGHLLSGNIKLTRNQWYMAQIGLSMTLLKDNRPMEAMKLIDDIKSDADNPVMLAYLKQVKGRILSDLGPSDEVQSLLDSAVRSFELQGIPLLCCIAYNNRGVYYFRKLIFDRAEEDWNKALKQARKAGSYYSEGVIRCNLADIEAQRKNFEKSETHLEKAREIFMERGDLEGLSLVEHNASIMFLEKGDLESALHHFVLSEEVADPLPTRIEKLERRNNFLRSAGHNDLPMERIEKVFSSMDVR